MLKNRLNPAPLTAVVAVFSIPAVLSAQQEDATPEPTSQVVLAVEHVGLSNFFMDPKDEALKQALEMLPARLRELPAEAPELAQVPQPAIELAISMLEHPGRLALTYDIQNQAGGGFGVGLVVSVGPLEREAADAMQGRVGALLAMGQMPAEPVPSQQYEGMREMYLPFGTARFGPRQADGGAWRYELHLGAMHDADAPFASLGEPRDGFTPLARGRLDFGPLAPLAQQMTAMFAAHNPEAAEGLKMLERYGLIGEDAISITFSYGRTPSHSVSQAVVHGMRRFAPAAGVSTQPLPASALRMVPADATLGGVQRMDLSSLDQWISQALEADPKAAEAMAQAQEMTGVHPINDVLATIGDTFGWYMADSTGGGGLGSIIAFVSLKDAEKFVQSNSKLIEFANAMLAQSEARGHVAVREWKEMGDSPTSLFSLTFPGLPVPGEVTYAISGEWLVAGLTPQAVLAATRQATGQGDAGLAANAAASTVLGRQGEVTSISFIDSSRTIRDGYALTAMLGSAVANLVRSPIGADREPGLIVPPYQELASGATPIVSISYWDGDDLVTQSTGDRSMLVNGAAAVGAVAPWFPVVGAIIGAAGAAADRHQHEEEWEPGWEGSFLPGLRPVPRGPGQEEAHLPGCELAAAP